MTKQVTQQALEALERVCSHGTRTSQQIDADWDFARATIEALREALAQQGEPVAWQRRMRLRESVRTFPQQSVWTEWFPCTEQAAQEFAVSKDEQWEYEVRALYTAAPAAQPDTKVICNWDGIGADK